MDFEGIVLLVDNQDFREADSQIKKWKLKYPGNTAVVCLQHYSAYKQGKSNAIDNARDFVKKETLNDANAVLLLYKIFNQEGLTKEAQQTYEAALRRYPILGSKLLPALIEELVNGVTAINIKELEKLLMQLQKCTSNAKDIYNAAFACSLITDDSAKLMNQLGLRLIEKIPLETTQQLYVVSKLNHNLGQWDAIIDSIESFKKSNKVELDLEIDALYADALIKTENWSKLRDYTSPKLTSFNDYTTILNFILANRNLDVSYAETKKTLESIPFRRNRELSFIELAVQYNVPHEQFLQQYYDNLKSKLCCFYDIRHYSNLSSIDLDEHSNDVYVETNNQKFKHLLAPDNELSLIKENKAIYDKFQKVTKLERYELFPANELMLMNLQLDKKLDRVQSVQMLQDLLAYNPDDPKVRMWMMTYLSQFGHFSQMVHHHFKVLKIKMIQIDTLGYYINNLVPLSQNVQEMFNLYRYYLTIPSENAPMVLGGLEKQVYTKLEGFINFYNRSVNSVGDLQLALNIVKMTTVLGMTDYLSFFVERIRTRFQLDLLNDNRDFKTLWKFGTNEHERETQVATDLTVLKMDYFKIRLLHERSSVKAQSLIKDFNKLLSGDLKPLNKFQIWLYRIYFNLFKYLHKYNAKEMESNFNYLAKNLKFSKVAPLLAEIPVLSSEYTQLIVSLVELAHNLSGLTVVKSQRAQLVAELKNINVNSLVTAELAKTGISKLGLDSKLDNYDILISSLN